MIYSKLLYQLSNQPWSRYNLGKKLFLQSIEGSVIYALKHQNQDKFCQLELFWPGHCESPIIFFSLYSIQNSEYRLFLSLYMPW